MSNISPALNDQPLVTIGVPVYNGEEYIQSALDSLLLQTYKNTKIVISDNASIDSTAKICREYENKCKNIHYYCNDTNYGPIYNFNKLVGLSEGKYFMWASSHDLWDPTFVSKCISIMEKEKDVTLVYSRTVKIDRDSRPLAMFSDDIDTKGMNEFSRYISIISNLHHCDMIYGVFRRDALKKCERWKELIGSDIAFLAELSLIGPVTQIKEPLYFSRKIRDESHEEFRQRTLENINSTKSYEKKKLSFRTLFTLLCIEHLKILSRSSLNYSDRIILKIITIYIFKKRFDITVLKLIFNIK